MKKRIFSFLLALLMALSLMPANLFVTVADAIDVSGSEIPVADNVIDITDKTVGSLSKYYANAVSVTIDGATVKQAFEDGTTVYVVLESGTAKDATVGASFNTTVNKFTVSGNTGTVTLADGEAELSLTLDAKYNGRVSYGSATYKLIFQVDEVPTAVPTRLQQTDAAATYNGVALQLDVSDYFDGAQTYYLAQGDSLTPLESKYYTFLSQTGGEHTLVFAAANSVGQCPDRVTVTVQVTEIQSGAWIGWESSNGSLDYVLFSDAEGNPIQDLKVQVEGTAIRAILPQSFDASGKITAEFSLTQNGSLPLLTTKTATSGTTSSRWDNSSNVFTKKTATLSSGKASLTFYYCNQSPKNESPVTWTLSYEIFNNAPVLSQGQPSAAQATVTAGQTYDLELSPLFTDAEGDALTYQVSVNGAAPETAEASYRFTTDIAGTYTLVFTANDGKDTSADSYTVTLTVENMKQTDSMMVLVPAELSPRFYVCPGFEGGVDRLGDEVETTRGATDDGLTAYTLHYPANATMLSVRTENWGGMAFPAEKEGTVTLRQVRLTVVDYENNPAASTGSVTYDGNTAAAGAEGWLLVTGREFSLKAVPTENTATLAQASEALRLEAGAEIYTHRLMLNMQNPMAITVPTGASAQLFKYDQYYSSTQLDAKIVKDNGDGTTTYNFVADTTSGTYLYKVTQPGKLTKAGWVGWGKQSLTVTYTDEDKDASFRLEDYSATGSANSGFTEDSVLLNINSQNFLQLSVGQTRNLKAYRAWEIIPVSYNNYILSPNFTYTVLSGTEVVSLTEKPSVTTGNGDWMTLTALKEGVAVIEVSYDAMQVSGGQYDGIYGATDPARTGLVVVQVGGSNDASVQFGIECLSSIGKSGSNNVSYDPNNRRVWDAEFDTLYFTGTCGQLRLFPSAASELRQVAVSNDQGASWTVLTDENGTYTAPIASGNNILRVTTASGTAYQVVRGDRVGVSLKEVEGKSDGDGIVEAGETVRVTLTGLHNPIPKMAGNYNPGYLSNSDGYSAQHLNYTANGTAVYGPGAQYNFITSANYIDILMPEDGSSVTLTDGYIGLGVIGLTGFADGGDSHRNIPDGGCGTRGSATSYHTRSLLPEITLSVGNTSSPNGAPTVRADALTQASIFDDQSYAVNPDTLFRDPDGDSLYFTVSVDGGADRSAGLDYKFTPGKAGTYQLTFTASDGKLTATHTLTLTVTERPKEEEKDDTFGLEEAEIAGFVTVSITDNGVRVTGETGLKFPVALGTIVAPTRVPFKEGENMPQVTKRLLDHLGMGMGHSGTLTSGFYLGAITNFEVDGTPYASMGEFDAGAGSGWMVTLNGWFINKGASDFTVQDGDAIAWLYTCQLGADIGDSYYASVKEVEGLIDKLDTVTLESREAIQAARRAYDALPADQKSRVTNYSKLSDAEQAYAKLEKEADEAAAKQVSELFDKLDSRASTFEEDVKKARQAYEALTDSQKKLVSNYQKLADALKALASQEDKEKAEAAEKQIAAIGTVTRDSAEAVRAARQTYEDLTDSQKAMVGNLRKLEEAEAQLRSLEALDRAMDLYIGTGNYLEELGTPIPGSVGGEWMVLGLIRSGRAVDEAYYAAVVQYVRENAVENRLHSAKSTENSRLILALTALGKDVTDVGGVDLLAGLNEMNYLRKQGINGPIWALIAFDSGNYSTPAGDVTREALIRAILDAQLSDGGWALSGDVSDVDMTGMALQALAPYYGTNEEVTDAVDMALELLSGKQNADGSFTGIDGGSSESVVQVIVALSALGIDAHTDARFIKNGNSALDVLCAYYVEGGGFRHTPDGSLDGMATEQGYYALTAYFRMLDGKKALYDMTDVVDLGGRETPAGAVTSAPKTQEPFLWWLLLPIPVAVVAVGAVVTVRKKRKN